MGLLLLVASCVMHCVYALVALFVCNMLVCSEGLAAVQSELNRGFYDPRSELLKVKSLLFSLNLKRFFPRWV